SPSAKVDAGARLRAVSATAGTTGQSRHPAVRRRATDAGDRARADDESALADSGRSHGGLGAARATRHLARPAAAEGNWPVHSLHRSEAIVLLAEGSQQRHQGQGRGSLAGSYSGIPGHTRNAREFPRHVVVFYRNITDSQCPILGRPILSAFIASGKSMHT